MINDICSEQLHKVNMSNVTPIHASRQPRRPHHIEAWAERRGLRQADLARELGVDKSQVSRWYAGATPSHEWQKVLADFFDIEPEALFRDPDDDWLMRFLRGREPDEITKIKTAMEMLFPRKTG